MIRKLKINEAKRYGKFDGLHHYIADQDWSKWSENDYKDVMFAIRDADRYQKTVDAGRGTSYTKQRADELWGEVERLIDKANKNADAERARYKKTANTKDTKKFESSCRENVSESVDGKIPYRLVSMLAALRDYVDTSDAYINKEHELLVDIADSLYNAFDRDELISELRPEYIEVYDKYGPDYFDSVIADMDRLDNFLSTRGNDVQDIINEYNNLASKYA